MNENNHEQDILYSSRLLCRRNSTKLENIFVECAEPAKINYVDKIVKFLPFVALFVILPAALVLFAILWKRHRDDKKR